MTVASARSRIAVKAKADSKLLDKLLHGMFVCNGLVAGTHRTSDHKTSAAQSTSLSRCSSLVSRPARIGVCSASSNATARAVLARPVDLEVLSF